MSTTGDFSSSSFYYSSYIYGYGKTSTGWKLITGWKFISFWKIAGWIVHYVGSGGASLPHPNTSLN